MGDADGTGITFRLFGLPFLVIGFYITFGQLFHRAWEWPRVTYLVTSKRLMIVSGLFAPRIASLYLDNLNALVLRYSLLDRIGNTGSIVMDSIQFMAVDDAAGVLHLIQQAREQAKKQGS